MTIPEIINYTCPALTIIAAVYYNIRWHIASKEENGKFSKEETINNAFGNVFFIMFVGYFGGKEIGWDVLLIVVAGMGAAHAITAFSKYKNAVRKDEHETEMKK
jgi:hypothetical protein